MALESDTLKWNLLHHLGQTFSLAFPHFSSVNSEPVIHGETLFTEVALMLGSMAGM